MRKSSFVVEEAAFASINGSRSVDRDALVETNDAIVVANDASAAHKAAFRMDREPFGPREASAGRERAAPTMLVARLVRAGVAPAGTAAAVVGRDGAFEDVVVSLLLL
jgi:hypothetical protein